MRVMLQNLLTHVRCMLCLVCTETLQQPLKKTCMILVQFRRQGCDALLPLVVKVSITKTSSLRKKKKLWEKKIIFSQMEKIIKELWKIILAKLSQ